ncbi:L-alanine-DL-glutamate epimerase-like enolase superfamily enzyme [Saccharopolyspora lacisalsi]|uniref:L-alanine-DL-glutamate epimerase-like enolase superfamily enzyme n=1 Tax=Halosaccharopolyspora lacisalsi TaxID=1000566 RepID=A0A839DZY4_9PSEU|nr:mandelate racemase/muconate lactonizing enzyme family protein [Halosaccharopolyspora lacisalsi]MBA8826410.1 L-alanine-DL-glutamate epimerase-like enolase superfamily enzyme [Halosaccharopolyspora lacisalsi]
MTTTEPVTTATSDRIARVRLSLVRLPLHAPISDAKVLTGRQKPLTEVALLFAEISTESGHEGLGFSYSKRAGGPALYAHAAEIAPELIGEDPNDIDRLWRKLAWAGASVGRSGLATQAIAAVDIALWDLKARRARLPLAKLLGAHRDSVSCYNTSGGFLSTPVEEMLDNTQRCLERGIGGVKIKVGNPDTTADIRRVEAVREHLGDHVPLMVDANQQWDHATAQRIGRSLERFDLTWIEEPLDAYDTEGHAALAAKLDTPVATGEMLTSFSEHESLVHAGACDFVQPDAPRVGGITPFLRIAALADRHHLSMAPHFAMEIHLHLAATYPRTTWVEHFEWLEPLFNERLELREGRMIVPNRPGLGLSLSDQCRSWTTEETTVRHRPA